jgi:hypothetical protein
MNSKENNIEILFGDLTPAKQQEILDKLGDNGNFDVFPIAAIPVGGGEREFTPEAAALPDTKSPLSLELTPCGEESERFYCNDESIGHLRGDFSKNGREFWHTWTENGEAWRDTSEFKDEFQTVVDALRAGVLKDFRSMEAYCGAHPEARLPGNGGRRFGLKLETENHAYYVRCTTVPNDYFYIFCYDRQALREQERAKPPVLDSEAAAMAKWRGETETAPGRWREDERYRRHSDGVLYYLGGDSGHYMRLTSDGRVTVGRYEFAKPGIKDAVLVAGATQDMGTYDRAVLLAAQLGGDRFLSDLNGMARGAGQDAAKPSVLKQIRDARNAPKPPRKAKSNEQRKGGAEL